MAIVLITQGFDLFSLIYLVLKKSYYFVCMWQHCVEVRGQLSGVNSFHHGLWA